MTITITKNYEVTHEDLVTILSAADCYRWYSTIMYNGKEYALAKEKLEADACADACFEDVLVQILEDGGKLTFVDSENWDVRYSLTLQMLYEGIKLAIDKEYYPEYHWYDDGKLDVSIIDGDVADVILQLGLFGEVMFG